MENPEYFNPETKKSVIVPSEAQTEALNRDDLLNALDGIKNIPDEKIEKIMEMSLEDMAKEIRLLEKFEINLITGLATNAIPEKYAGHLRIMINTEEALEIVEIFLEVDGLIKDGLYLGTIKPEEETELRAKNPVEALALLKSDRYNTRVHIEVDRMIKMGVYQQTISLEEEIELRKMNQVDARDIIMGKKYKVKSGDNLWNIVKRHFNLNNNEDITLKIEEIVKLNPELAHDTLKVVDGKVVKGSDTIAGDRIFPGQVIKLTQNKIEITDATSEETNNLKNQLPENEGEIA